MMWAGWTHLDQGNVSRWIKIYCKGRNWIQVRQDTFLCGFF